MTHAYDIPTPSEAEWRIDFGVHHPIRSTEANDLVAHKAAPWGHVSVSWPHTAANPTLIGWSYPGGYTEQE